MLDPLQAFIQSNPDARELKRAVAVKIFLQGYKHREIDEMLGVSSGFISKWTRSMSNWEYQDFDSPMPGQRVT